MKAEVVYRGVLDCQVCAPKNWTDKQVKDFANTENL